MLSFGILQASRTFYTTRADRSFRSCQGFSEMPAFCSLTKWCRPWTPWLKMCGTSDRYAPCRYETLLHLEGPASPTQRHRETAHPMASGIYFSIRHRGEPRPKPSEIFLDDLDHGYWCMVVFQCFPKELMWHWPICVREVKPHDM